MSILKSIRSIVETVEEDARGNLTPERFAHVCSVRDLAEELAGRFDVSVEKAVLAAVAHDLDRERSKGQLLGLCSDWGFQALEIERRTPVLLHGPVAAERLRRRYSVTDNEVLTAIRCHTLGSPLLAEREFIVGLLLFVADFCEPLRSWPAETVRTDVLGRGSLREMAAEVIRIGAERWGAVEEPTAQMYARLLEKN